MRPFQPQESEGSVWHILLPDPGPLEHLPSQEGPGERWTISHELHAESGPQPHDQRSPLDSIATVPRTFAVTPGGRRSSVSPPERMAEWSQKYRELIGDNIWLGTSIEDQERADARLPWLRRTYASVRFLSCEPLLGALELELGGIAWVIVGGESGPRCRPVDRDWVRAIRDRCVSDGVAFFFKQWGGVRKKEAGRVLDGETWDEFPTVVEAGQGVTKP